MSDEKTQLRLEIAHVLFIDIVGYSKLLINQQSELLEHLKKMVRGSDEARTAEAEGKLIRLATGDGLALVFRSTPEAPAQCALEATYLDSFQFAQLPGETERELRGSFLPGVDPDEGYLKWKANSTVDWAWHGWDLLTTVHYLDGFHEVVDRTIFSGTPYPDGKKEHYIKQTWFFDLQASYNFTFAPPVEIQPVAGYAKDARDVTRTGDGKSAESAGVQTANLALPIWKRVLNNTTVTLGCNDVFGQDPPDAGTSTKYADFLYDSTGRFVYVGVSKKF